MLSWLSESERTPVLGGITLICPRTHASLSPASEQQRGCAAGLSCSAQGNGLRGSAGRGGATPGVSLWGPVATPEANAVSSALDSALRRGR